MGNSLFQKHIAVRNDLGPAAANGAGNAKTLHLILKETERPPGIQIYKMSRLAQRPNCGHRALRDLLALVIDQSSVDIEEK